MLSSCGEHLQSWIVFGKQDDAGIGHVHVTIRIALEQLPDLHRLCFPKEIYGVISFGEGARYAPWSNQITRFYEGCFTRQIRSGVSLGNDPAPLAHSVVPIPEAGNEAGISDELHSAV